MRRMVRVVPIAMSFFSVMMSTLLSASASTSSCSVSTFLFVSPSANAVVGTRQNSIQRVSRILSIRFFILHYLRVDTIFCVSR